MSKTWGRLSSRIFGFSAGALLVAWSAMALAADVPKFEVDPFWPKPLPNNWAIGQVAGVAVDERDHVWIIQRPNSLARGEKLAAANPPIAKCCVPAPSIIEFDPESNVVQAWGGPGQGYDSRDNVFTTEVFEGKRIQRWKVISGAPQR